MSMTNVNCKWNTQVAFCTNPAISRSLWGFGARLCIECPPGEICGLKVKYSRPPAPPGQGNLAWERTRARERDKAREQKQT